MFDFYFQSGEFIGDSSDFLSFASDLIVQIAGTFVGAWFAIRLYRKQIKDQRNKDVQDQQNKDLDNVRYLDFMVQNSIKAVEGLAKSFRQLAEELPKAKNALPDLEIFSSYHDIERLSKMVDQGQLFHSYSNLNRKHKFDPEIKSLYFVFVNIDSAHNNIVNGIAFKQDRSKSLEQSLNSLIKTVVLQNTKIELLTSDKLYLVELAKIKEEYNEIRNIIYLERLSRIKDRAERISQLISKLDLSSVDEDTRDIYNINSDITTQLDYLRPLFVNFTGGILSYAEMFEQSAAHLKYYSRHLRSYIESAKL